MKGVKLKIRDKSISSAAEIDYICFREYVAQDLSFFLLDNPLHYKMNHSGSNVMFISNKAMRDVMRLSKVLKMCSAHKIPSWV